MSNQGQASIAGRIASIEKDLHDNYRRAKALTSSVWKRMNEGWRPTPAESEAVMSELAVLADEAERLRGWRDRSYP